LRLDENGKNRKKGKKSHKWLPDYWRILLCADMRNFLVAESLGCVYYKRKANKWSCPKSTLSSEVVLHFREGDHYQCSLFSNISSITLNIDYIFRKVIPYTAVNIYTYDGLFQDSSQEFIRIFIPLFCGKSDKHHFSGIESIVYSFCSFEFSYVSISNQLLWLVLLTVNDSAFLLSR
jgi:hypothetical protein